MMDDTADDELQATISAAIQSARYNEAVILTVGANTNNAIILPDDSSSLNEIVLVACLDQENGGIVWRNDGGGGDDDDDDDDDGWHCENSHQQIFPIDPGIVRHLRTKRWILPMLNDHRRNHIYEHAIRQACAERMRSITYHHRLNDDNHSSTDDLTKKIDSKPSIIVRILDIGTGTGLLAMMGAKSMKKEMMLLKRSSSLHNDQLPTVQVTTVEMASAMARLARMTIVENEMSDEITVVEHHSTDSSFHMDDSCFRNMMTDMVDLPEETMNNINRAATSSPKKRQRKINDGTNRCCHANDNIHNVHSNNNNYNTNRSSNNKADICTSELLESGLLGEGILPSIRDAWMRHLTSDAIVIPRRARVYAVLVEGLPILRRDSSKDDNTLNAVTSFVGPELHTFYNASGGVWMSTSNGSLPNPSSSSVCFDKNTSSDGSVAPLLGSSNDTENYKIMVEGMGGTTIPLHAAAMLVRSYQDDVRKNNPLGNISYEERREMRPLTAPKEVLNFVFSEGIDNLPPPGGGFTINEVSPIANGNCHGVLFWWELDLWDDEISTISTIPDGLSCNNSECDRMNGKESSLNFQDHWLQCLYVFCDNEKKNKRYIKLGDSVKIITMHNDSSISFSLSTSNSEIESKTSLMENNESDALTLSNKHITSTRALQLNDVSRTNTLKAAIQYCIDIHGYDSPLLDVSDMGLCAMIASVLGSRNVTSLESSSGSLPILAATIAQIGNGLPRQNAEFQIIQAQPEHLLTEHVLGGAAEIVVAEPYYETLEGWHLQEALNYFYTLRSLKKRGVVTPKALSVPAYADVMACAVEFEQFCTAYGQVGEVAGIKHSSVNHFGNRFYSNDISLPLWQYRYKPLSKPLCVARILYECVTPTIEIRDGGTEFSQSGVAQVVVIWVDYACRTKKEDYDVISTASSSQRQLVRKLKKPFIITDKDIKAGTIFTCRASFGSNSPGIEDHLFSFDIKRAKCNVT